jgi:membrane protease YdiL (CAAX protease family)
MYEDSVFGANEEYVEQTKKYGRLDAILAAGLYIVMLPLLYLIGKIFVSKGSELTEGFIFCADALYALVCAGFVFFFCFIRKQKLVTIGFSKSLVKKSLYIGLILLIVVVIVRRFIPMISGKSVQTDISSIVMNVISNLVFVAFLEELVFRGYIGTRFYGHFKNKKFSIIVVGVMFAFMHIALKYAVDQISFIDFVGAYWMKLSGYFLFHIFFQWLYSKYNSIIAPTIVHFTWDFMIWFIIL